MPQVSLLATLVATAVAFALGALWYGPLFGRAWMAEHGFTEEKLREGFNPAKIYGTTAGLTLLTAYVFGAFVGAAPGAAAIAWGFAAGLFFVALSLATISLFERSSRRLWLIHGDYHTVRFTLMGLAFAWLG